MPFTPNTILPPQPVRVVVALEPVYNILVSMAVLNGANEVNGLSEWAIQTAQRLPADQRLSNDLIFGGIGVEALTNLAERGAATEDFSLYLQVLHRADPVALRDRLLAHMIHSAAWRTLLDAVLLPEPSVAEILREPKLGIQFFEERARQKGEWSIGEALFALLLEPPRLQATLLDHLSWLWERELQTEWTRIRPLLQESVEAFQALNLSGLTILEAMQVVTDRDLRAFFRLEALLGYTRIRFIPTLHNGPYISWFGDDEELRMTYAARRPQRNSGGLSLLDRSELVNRLAALADETRLQILILLQQAGDLSTQAVMERLTLNKSMASRHLRQLCANNLISERREEGAKKVYRLNARVLEELGKRLATLSKGG
jgi:DNA-binding transcriptional ArsR family regulator